MANASLPIRSSLTGASDGLKVDNHIISKDFAFGHDIEMIAVSVVVLSADGRTPDFVSVVGAEVSDHNNNTFASDTSFTAAIAGCAGRARC